MSNANTANPKRRRVSRTLSLFIGGEILKVFLLVLAIQLIVFGAVFTINASQEYGLDPSLLLRVFRITFAYSLYYTIPISILIATGLSFGRMIADREIAAFRGFGISHLEMIVPPAVLGVGLMAAALFINGYVIPEVRHAKDNLGRLILDQLRSMDDGYDKSFYLDRETKTNKIVVEELRGGVLRNIFLFAEEPARIFGGIPGVDSESAAPDDESDEKTDAVESEMIDAGDARSFPAILHADEGEVMVRPASAGDVAAEAVEDRVFLELRRVDIYYDQDFRSSKERESKELQDFLQVARFARLEIPISGFGQKERVMKAMPNPMLLEHAESRWREHIALETIPEPTEKDRKESIKSLHKSRKARGLYHRRLTYAATAFIFPIAVALIALTLNSTNRLLPFFVGTTVCCLVFFPLEVQGKELAWRLDQMWLAHLGNIALLLIAIVLFVRLERVSRRRRRREAPPRSDATGEAS